MDPYNILTDLFSSVSMVVPALAVYRCCQFLWNIVLSYKMYKCKRNPNNKKNSIRLLKQVLMSLSHKCMLQHVTEENSVQKV